MSMLKTMVMTVGTLALLGGMAMADNLNGDIPPQPSAMGNAIAETFNEIKHATIDTLHQEQADRNQILKLSKSFEAHILKLKEQRAQVEQAQRDEKNASNAVGNGDDNKAKKTEITKAAADLKAADADLIKAIELVEKMKGKIDKVGQNKNPVGLDKDWKSLKTAMQTDNKVLMKFATSATTKIASASKVIDKYKDGTSTTASNTDAAGSFKVTLTKWSCKKTELYVNNTKLFGKDAAKSVNIGKDGSFTLKAMIVDPRREQARQYIGKERTGGSIKISAASEYILSYSNGTKSTDWRVASETYEWQKAEGNNVEGKASSSGATAKDDQFAIQYPTNAQTNNIHGWVKAEIKWKGAQEEAADENCSYDLNLAPAK